ncbi:Hypothetical predicted protein [Octopus vulgaris]|uniref:Uncharacterized protein n=1 Tax=Octopus vulgaris TaxID=6645 RepID=A0AA36B708_OCTVU|nr:Hypothetical predicted protein [Octopus vulgaris]
MLLSLSVLGDDDGDGDGDSIRVDITRYLFESLHLVKVSDALIASKVKLMQTRPITMTLIAESRTIASVML